MSNYQFHHLSYLSQMAINAAAGIHMDPKATGMRNLAAYDEQLVHLLARVPEQHREWVKTKYIQLLCAFMRAESRCMSTFITGPANFPVKTQEKYRRWRDNHRKVWVEWCDHIVLRLNRKEKIELSLEEQLVKTENEIADMELFQKQMVETNKILRDRKLSTDEKLEELEDLGLSAEQINERFLNPPHWMNGLGYAQFELTNHNAKIKNRKQNLIVLQRRIEAESAEMKRVDFKGGYYVENVHDDRLQIHFDEKPDYNLRDTLKRNGFKWAPSVSAWQTYLASGRHKIHRLNLQFV